MQMRGNGHTDPPPHSPLSHPPTHSHSPTLTLPHTLSPSELRVQVGALSYANSYPGFDPVMARQALQSEDRLRTQYLLKCAHKAQGLGVGEVGWVADCAAVLLAEAGSTYELTVLATLRRRRELEVEKEVEEREREREYVGAGDRVRAVPVT
ncbi:hypothetical protein B484DRAFT_135702 [Ochromonadaceae sp. CCMP2298]|nr:hypothetical protein B484DRAFT_135702 [Ochromonadaceae sp. CCMP2298]